MKTHELKCHPHFFEALKRGDKNFEIRRNDRRFANGDELVIRKFDPSFGLIPGEAPFVVTYIMGDEDFPAIAPGFVIMGIKPVEAKAVGAIINDLPVLQDVERCNEYRKVAGLVLPRTCAKCGLGKCVYSERNEDG